MNMSDSFWNSMKYSRKCRANVLLNLCECNNYMNHNSAATGNGSSSSALTFDTFQRGNKSLQFLVIGRLQNRCGDALFFLFLPTGKYMTHCIRRDHLKFPIIQSMVAKRGLINLANVHTPMWKHLHSRIPIDPGMLAAIGHRFIATIKNIKNANKQVGGDMRGDQKPEIFLGA